MAMPGGETLDSNGTFFGQNLTDYVRNGTIPESRIDDMATRILASWYFLGQDKDYPPGKGLILAGGRTSLTVFVKLASMPSTSMTKLTTNMSTFKAIITNSFAKLVLRALFFSKTRIMHCL